MDKQYLKGFYVDKKKCKYGEFYKCSIKYDDFLDNAVPDVRGYVRFCIFKNKEGYPYAVLDNYSLKPKEEEKLLKFDEDQLPF